MAQNCGGPAAPGATLLQSFTPAGCHWISSGKPWKTRPVLKKYLTHTGTFSSLPKRNGTVLFFQRKLNLSKRRNVMTRLSCWHLHQQGQRAFPTTSFSTGAGHDVVGDHVWEHLQFNSDVWGETNGQRDQTQIEVMQPPMCENVLEKHVCRELFGREKIIKKTVGRAKMFVPREKRCGLLLPSQVKSLKSCRLRSHPVPSIKYQNLRLQWHQNNDNDINKISKTSVKEIGYQMFNPIPHTTWNLLKTWRQKSTGRPVKRQWVFSKSIHSKRNYSPMTDYTQFLYI